MARAIWESTEEILDLRGLILVVLAVGWLGGGVLASFFLTASSLAHFLPSLEWILLLGAGVALVFIWLLRQDRLSKLLMLLLLCALLGAWRYALALPGEDPRAISAFIGNSRLNIRGLVVDEPELQGWGSSRAFVVAVSSVSRDGGTDWLEAHGELAVVTRGTTIDDPYGANYGDQVELIGKVQKPAPSVSPGVFASMAFPLIAVQPASSSLLAQLYHLRVSLAILLTQLLPQPEAALLIAVLLGLRTPELKPFALYFNVTGTAHLIASSGFKVTILAGLVANSIKWFQSLAACSPLRDHGSSSISPQRTWQAWWPSLVVILSIACYTLLSGAGAAAIRAGVMGGLIVIAPRLGRTYHVYNALAATALLMDILNPFVLVDVGFQLSFLGTLGILLFTPYIQCWFAPVERFPFGLVVSENIAVALAAEIATWPISALAFLNISLISPLANVLTVPLLEILLIPGVCICLASCICMPLATLGAWIIWPVLWYVLHVLQWCALIPDAYFPVNGISSGVICCYYIALASAYLWLIRGKGRVKTEDKVSPSWQRASRCSLRLWRIGQLGAAGIVVLTMGADMFIAQHTSSLLTVTFLPVGLARTQQLAGESILIRTTDNKAVLIDGGLDANSLSEQLDSRLPPWQRSLDLVVLTSPRSDHITGLLDIIQRYQIGEVIDAGMLHPDTTYALWYRNINERKLKYLRVAQGMTIPVGNIALQILWPLAQLHKGSNEVFDNSMVIRLVLPGLHILLLGAVAQSSYALQGLISGLSTEYLRAEVVQVEGRVGKAVPAELGMILGQTHAKYLIVTPAAPSSRQRKSGQESLATLPVAVTGGSWQTIVTEQVGAVEIVCQQHSWTINSA